MRLHYVLLILILPSMSFVNAYLDGEKWVVVVTVSKWYDEIFQNWLIWYNLLDLKMETIVIAEDSFTYKKYANHSEFTVMRFEMEEVRSDVEK